MRLRATLTWPLVAAALPAGAADFALEEVQVSASRRDTPLLVTPVAVSSFNSDVRNLLGIDNDADLALRTPSLTTVPYKVSIRGVGRPNNALGSDPGVGIYWDGVYSSENEVFSYARGLDLDRIEVLRGPQGTLYGRNTVGGAINYVSLQPSPWWTGQVVAEVANYEGTMLQGLARGPITQDFSILAAASVIQRDGFQKNGYNGKDYEQDDSRYLTLAFRHLSTDRWTNTLKLVAADRDFRPSNEYAQGNFSRDYIQQVSDVDTGELLNFPGMFPQQNFANHFQGMAIDNPALANESRVFQDFSPSQVQERLAAFFTSHYAADRFSLTYIGGFSDADASLRLDADNSAAETSGLDWREVDLFGTPVSELTGYTLTPSDMRYSVDQSSQTVSHELQLQWQPDSPLSFIGGLYYYRADEDQLVSYRELNDELMAVYRYFGSLPGLPVSDENVLFRGEADLVTRSTAAYGQLEWDITPSLGLTLGLRYSHDEKDGGDNTFVQYVGDLDDPTVFREEKDDWSQPTWRVGLDYQLADSHFLYGLISSGYRSGGFNFIKPGESSDVDVVDPEELISYELGYKATLLDGRLALASAAYFYDYQDIQVLKTDLVNGIHLYTFENSDEARAHGVELELSAQLVEGLSLSGYWSYNKTEYRDYLSVDANACALGPLAEGRSQDPLCTDAQQLRGNQFPLAPEHKAAANLVYNWRLMSLAASATLSYLYTGEQYMSAFNRDDLDKVDSRDRLDARFSLASLGGSWGLTAWVKNLTDDREISYLRRPLALTQLATADLTAPRTYGLRLDYRF